ncbi:MAG TPA: NAD-dependent succinate-semialdehyde dehydrogenase [Pusillimonas sp.]|uniref:NAD-dependent succinate-semialdehyde dehydrogenase n=1 Tax=Pusillimonas sp. TaxID=3040095 RepID=UPI002D0C2A2F|nr:NAD-dependent succinate-semialdehyde dehydrogenase [Pusillimonas sp.]HUH87066.1 NAD-dependent succinate-semialdehyde dehydrogenase [Pusillimonas sp.]
MNNDQSLCDQSLLKDEAYIGGQWVAAESSASLNVYNPATGELVGVVPDMGAAEAHEAVEAASRAFPDWSSMSAKERGVILKQWARLINLNRDAIAEILTAEQGKPLADARNEVAFSASFVEWFAEEGKRTYGEVIPAPRADMRYLVQKEPIGVCAGITPWNLPCAMVTRKAAPALAAGCTMVLKPAEHTPLTALALAALAEQAGLPPGVLNVVTAGRQNAAAVGAQWTASHAVAKVSFTGSTAVGKRLIAQCADTVKKVSMELGGNSAFIVMADADLEIAVAAAMFAKFRNAGQTCIAPNRFFVHESVLDEFSSRLQRAMQGIVIGNGAMPGTTLGPLITDQAVAKVRSHVDDALSKGARLQMGGQKPDGVGCFYEPTLLLGVTADMLMCKEETFGPVVGITAFSDEAPMLQAVNATRLGLAAYLFSTNAATIHRTTRLIEAGIVGVNTGMIATEVAPFGGYKESGIGREGARQGIDEFLETKFICEAFPT